MDDGDSNHRKDMTTDTKSGENHRVETFPPEKDVREDTTAAQAKLGKDIQGIPWERLGLTREQYRARRLKEYNNFVNSEKLQNRDQWLEYKGKLAKLCTHSEQGHTFFEFTRNSRHIHSSIVHFQLRNLLWATSPHDIFVTHEKCVKHWNLVSRSGRELLNLAGGAYGGRAPNVGGAVSISTLCVGCGLAAAGGFNGELCVRRLDAPEWVYSGRITSSNNGIANAIEIFQDGGRATVVTSNNDAVVRCFDVEGGFRIYSQMQYPWAVNFSTTHPRDRNVLAVVGDDPVAVLTDLRSSRRIASLHGHLDFSFAAAWHPAGRELATGNQDTTTRIWDIRYLSGELACLPGNMGSVRSCRYSPDGRFLASAEPADFVKLFDVASQYQHAQEIDLFGEISGISFSPCSERLFVGVSDMTYSSVLQFDRFHAASAFDIWL